jgi:hypothetical protein
MPQLQYTAAMKPSWPPGTGILLRSVAAGVVHMVRSMTVVRDDPGLLMLYIGPGYPCKRRQGVRGGPRNRVLLSHTGHHDDWRWSENRVLAFYRPGDAHAVYLFWSDVNDAFSGYYIDLLEPFQRTPVGFDTRDRVLDIWIESDRRTWTWKDEDEVAWQIETGRMSQQEADAIRAEGVRAVTQFLDSAEYERWTGWRPDPSWTTSVFPSDWQTIFPTHE